MRVEKFGDSANLDSVDQPMVKRRYLTSRDVIKELGISRGTLYSYVSRGLIRSHPDTSDPRKHWYSSSDLEKLKKKKGEKSPRRAVAAALNLGLPLLASAVAEIRDGRIFYRGQDALVLSHTSSFEEVCALLWNRSSLSLRISPKAPIVTSLLGLQKYLIEMCEVNGTTDPGELLGYMVSAVVGVGEGRVAERISHAWCNNEQYGRQLIEESLVLSADHELNISSFTARCVASTRAPLSACIVAALSAFQGAAHGAATLTIEHSLMCYENPPLDEIVISQGFGNPLYPDGDPRARSLLNSMEKLIPENDWVRSSRAICDSVQQEVGEFPGWEFALSILGLALGFSPGSSTLLFALGRAAGWIAHALEQYEEKELIRPRAGSKS